MQIFGTSIFENVCEGITLAYIILASLAFLIVLITWLNTQYFCSPILWTLRRWIRAAFVSIAIFILLSIFSDKNPYFIFALALSAYFFGDSLILWKKACEYSNKNIIPFDKFKEVPNAWRSDKKSLLQKIEIEKIGFNKIYSAVSGIDSVCCEKEQQYITIFFNEKDNVYLLTSFTKNIASVESFFVFISHDESGRIFATNNSAIPFAFVVPKFAKIKFVPMRRNLCALLKSHNRFLKKHDCKNSIPFDCAESLLQKISDNIYKESISKNIMNNKNSAITHELLTSEGKYHLWKKTFLANYFLRLF